MEINRTWWEVYLDVLNSLTRRTDWSSWLGIDAVVRIGADAITVVVITMRTQQIGSDQPTPLSRRLIRRLPNLPFISEIFTHACNIGPHIRAMNEPILCILL